MKRLAFIVAGAVVCLVLGTILISFLPEWDANSLQGESRANFVSKLLISIWIGLIIIGAWIGDCLYKGNPKLK